MMQFKRVIKPTDLVAEVGGHIGYTTLWFAKLAHNGKVVVFEPGQNNLPYIRKNIAKKQNVELVEIGLGSEIGEAVFYEESVTGQNNSFVKDFDGFKANAAFSKQEQNVIGRVVRIGRLDDYFEHYGHKPDFIKIDVEGFEFEVLQGCMQFFKNKWFPKFMVEVQSKQSEIFELFSSYGYKIYDNHSVAINDMEVLVKRCLSNLFFLHPERHSEEIGNIIAGRKQQ